jgi:hypothetical protein
MNKLLAIVVAAAAVVIGAALPAGADGLAKDAPLRAPERAAPQPTVPAGSACVDASGRWVNWPYVNVPTLSPPCPAPSPAQK